MFLKILEFSLEIFAQKWKFRVQNVSSKISRNSAYSWTKVKNIKITFDRYTAKHPFCEAISIRSASVNEFSSSVETPILRNVEGFFEILRSKSAANLFIPIRLIVCDIAASIKESDALFFWSVQADGWFMLSLTVDKPESSIKQFLKNSQNARQMSVKRGFKGLSTFL